MKSLVKKVVFGALFLMNVGLVFAHPPVDPPDNPYVPPRVIEIASELHEEIVSPFEERKAEKKSELECKFKKELERKMIESNNSVKRGQKTSSEAQSVLKEWHEKRKAELELELKNYCKEIDSELKDKSEKGELEIKWDPFRKYDNFQPMTFTTDIPPCVLDKKALKYKNFSPKNGCVVYGYSKDRDEFQATSMSDMLTRGLTYSRTVYTPGVKVRNLPKPTCLLLNENTRAVIEDNQPGWKPRHTFVVDKLFNIYVNLSVDELYNLLQSKESK